LQQIIL